MNKIDYWFLDIVVLMPVGINCLVPDRNGFIDINKKPLDISLIEMAEVLDKLFKQEYLCASKPYGINEGDSSPGNIIKFIPSKDEILHGLQTGVIPEVIEDGDDVIEKYDNLFDFFLAKKGGLIWESVSNPRWEKYFCKYTAKGAKGDEKNIYCHTKKLAKKLMKIESLLDYHGCHIEPISGTEKWDIVRPWHATYWKNIYSGYKLSYEFELSEFDLDSEDSNKSQYFIDQRNEARKWYKNICNNWYTQYFKA